MVSRIVSILVTAVMLLSLSGLAFAAEEDVTVEPNPTFTDIPHGIWYGEDVALLTSKGIIEGRSPGIFSPDTNITRAELSAIFMRSAGVDEDDYTPVESFTDVKEGEWYYTCVSWAKENKVVNGYDDGTFLPNKNITRQEIAKMTMNYINNCTDVFLPQPYSAITFFDDKAIGPWVKSEIITLQRCALLTGFENLHFCPQDSATRAQSAHIVAKLLRIVADPSDIPTQPNYRKISGNPYSGYARLVNRTYSIPNGANYTPNNLTTVSGSSVRMEAQAAAALVNMRNGYKQSHSGNFIYQSGYRSYDYQTTLYNRKVGQVGSRTGAAVISAIPGTSEHQTGLAIDISVNGSLTTGFASTTLGQWLSAHCHEYGYILRYPANKEKITGITYEPWHFRYVGVEVATEMKSQGYTTLEEYYGLYLSKDDIDPYLPYLK